jgi:hypothetical protein
MRFGGLDAALVPGHEVGGAVGAVLGILEAGLERQCVQAWYRLPRLSRRPCGWPLLPEKVSPRRLPWVSAPRHLSLRRLAAECRPSPSL